MPLPLTGSAAVENDEEVLEWTGAPLTPLNCVAGAAIMLDGLGYFVGERIDTSHVRLTRAYAGATDTVAAEITQLSPEQVATATLNKRAAEVMSQLSVLDANGRGLFYNLIGVTGDNDPGPGNIALDAAGAGVSEIYIDVLDANEGGRDVSGIIGLWEAGTVLVLRSLATNAYLAAVLTEAPAGSGGYRRLAVEVIGSDGELAAEPLAVEWVLKGERGEAYATDATVADMAGLTDYDAEDDGFRVFVRDLGAGYDNRSGVVVKAASVWDVTALYTGPRGYPSTVPGPAGPPGIVWLGAWDDETVFALNDGVENNGSSWRSLQDDNLNHPPPALPATSNAWWQLVAKAGQDGTGTGDVVGPAGAVDGRVAVFDGTTGKLIKDSGLKPEDIGSVDALFEDDLGKTPIEQAQARLNTSAASSVDTRRNLFVNGSFGVSQENDNTLGTTNGYYPADQIALYFTAATAAMSVQRVQARTLANALDQIEFKTTTAKAVLGTSDFVTLTQNIEGSAFAAFGFGTAAAVPMVLRAEVKLPDGTYHFHFANSANDRHCAVPFTISAGEANTAVVKEVVVPPDTAGAWLTADGVIGITCDLVLAAGSGNTGGAASTWGSTPYLAASAQKNILDSTANVARLADIGLKLDPDATGVYGQYEVGEVDAVYRSERYARRRSGRRFVSGPIESGGNVYVSEALGVVMAKPPSLTFETAEAVSFGVGWVAAFGPATINGDTPSTVDTISYVVRAYSTGTAYQAVAAYANWLALARLS